MEEKKTLKLNFELIPDSCWASNLRTLLKPEIWDAIRKEAYARAGGRCMICGRPETRLEAHEVWSYDIENELQRLEDVVAVCHDCHSVIHIGRTQLVGDEERAIRHFCAVNECGYPDYVKALGEANALHRKRNEVGDWKLDIATFLKKLYG